MNEPRILIAGIGNIFFRDDAFGVDVARKLAGRAWPDGVQVVDFGIRGLDLAYALLEQYEAAILVDAVRRDGPPGTIHVLDVTDQSTPASEAPMADAHSLDPWKVLKLAKGLGCALRRIYLVGCEPKCVDMDEEIMEMSEPVRAAVDDAVEIINLLVERIRGEIAADRVTASS
jgi:hydrogenase maturation protease